MLCSEDLRFQAGDRVVLNGYGLGEVHHGGYAERARVKGDWLIRLPANISTVNAMAVGTAGVRHALRTGLRKGRHHAGQWRCARDRSCRWSGSGRNRTPDQLGYRVVASSRRAEQERNYLQGLGADEIIDARELSGAGVPLDKERWAGAVDSLGSRTLANVLSQIRYDGVVAACGLAQGPDLPATVMPFILRDVTLAGVNSVFTPREKREEAWARLATDLDLAKLNRMEPVPPGEARRRAVPGGRNPRRKNAWPGGHRSLINELLSVPLPPLFSVEFLVRFADDCVAELD